MFENDSTYNNCNSLQMLFCWKRLLSNHHGSNYNRISCWLADWLASWLPNWRPGWLAGVLVGCQAASLPGRMAGWLASWLAGWLTGWMVGWLTGPPAGWLAGCLASCWAGWLPREIWIWQVLSQSCSLGEFRACCKPGHKLAKRVFPARWRIFFFPGSGANPFFFFPGYG